MSKPYMPTNGTEGETFMTEWCDNCHHCEHCTILNGSLVGIQPKEWVRDPSPKCTAFVDADNYKYKQIVTSITRRNMKAFITIMFFAVIALLIYYIVSTSSTCAEQGGVLVRPAVGVGLQCVAAP